MGDVADDMFDEAINEQAEVDNYIMYLLTLQDNELKDMCKSSRKPIILGIRKYPYLSPPQRLVLARHIAYSEPNIDY